MSMLVGEGAVGKSSIVSGMALSLVTGKPLLGAKVHGAPKRVWIVNLEDSHHEVTRSIQAAATHWGVPRQNLWHRFEVVN
jgi:RecA-family ATPase